MWWIPTGETPDRYKNIPELKGIDIGDTGTGAHTPMVVTDTLLIYASTNADGSPALFAIDKTTGKQLEKIDAPAGSRYGMMTYTHEGHQYIMLQTGSKLTTMALPGAGPGPSVGH